MKIERIEYEYTFARSSIFLLADGHVMQSVSPPSAMMHQSPATNPRNKLHN